MFDNGVFKGREPVFNEYRRSKDIPRTCRLYQANSLEKHDSDCRRRKDFLQLFKFAKRTFIVILVVCFDILR